MTTIPTAPEESFPDALAPPVHAPLTTAERFDWIVVALSCVFIVGVVIDSRGHLQGQVDTSLLSLRHAPLYGGVTLVGAFLAASASRNWRVGSTWRNALPAGYDLSLVGAIGFLLAGIADLGWHMAFGVEQGLATLISPTHLVLALFGGLMVSGPLRAAHSQVAIESARTWRVLGPALVSTVFVLTLTTVLTAYAHPLVGVYAAARPSSAVFPQTIVQPLAVGSILLQTIVLTAMLTWVVRQRRLPPGAVALVVLGASVPVIVLASTFGFLPTVVIAALAAELEYWLARPASSAARLYIFAGAVPATFYACYFVTLALGPGIGWSPHLVAGSLVLAGLCGALVAVVTHSDLSSRRQAPEGIRLEVSSTAQLTRTVCRPDM